MDSQAGDPDPLGRLARLELPYGPLEGFLSLLATPGIIPDEGDDLKELALPINSPLAGRRTRVTLHSPDTELIRILVAGTWQTHVERLLPSAW